MLLYRKALIEDADKIAFLHATNWQLNYRGILDDHYLDHQVIDDRKKVWQERLLTSDPNMHLILAEEASQIVGFGCLFFEDSKEYGAYLDNLHVFADFSGRGIGKMLMSLLAEEVVKREGRNDMYLWVLKDNLGAIRLYEKLKAQKKEQLTETELGNNPVEKIRYYWPNVSTLIID